MTDAHDQSNAVWLAAYEGKPTDKSAKDTQSAQPKRFQHINRFEQKKQDPKIIEPDDMAELIPEGLYAARCCEYTLTDFWSSSKLVLKFEITEGHYSGTKLECYYNLNRKKNASGEYDYVPSKRGAYLRMMKQAFSDAEKSGGDWLSPENLIGKIFRTEVKTVNKNHAKEALGSNQYSKIKTNIELLHE